MAWSEAARRAAIEARRRKAKMKVKIVGTSGGKKYAASIGRQDYAAYLKDARAEARGRWGHSSIKRRNRWARATSKTTAFDDNPVRRVR